MRAGGSGDLRDAPEVVSGQLGRALRGDWAVAVSCPFGFPAVVETAPYLADGTPFPTLYYLTCPSAVDEVAGREAAGGVEEFRRAVAADPRLMRAFAALDLLQRRRRRELASRGDPGFADRAPDGGAVLERGIGGPKDATQATCLHAYTATLLAAVSGALGHGAERPPEAGWESLLGDSSRLWCDDARCVGLLPGRWEKRAAVDVGTNSVRSLVAAVGESDAVLGLVRRAEITQLGAGLVPGRPLDPEARRRTSEVAAALVAEARALGAGAIHLVGTSAARDAADGPAFIAELGRDLGVAARVATGPEEAEFTFRGATRGLPGDPVVIDIGGGSTELVRRAASVGEERPHAEPRLHSGPRDHAEPRLHLGPRDRTEPRDPAQPPAGPRPGPGPAADATGPSVDAVSLDLGCVRGTADWFASDPPSSGELRAARRRSVEAFAARAPRFASRPGERLVGVAGTITTLACLALSLPEYDPDAIHLRSLERGVLEELVEGLAAMGAAERAALPCMQRGRGGVIVAGGVILLAALEALGWDELTVSERDLLDGILLSAVE